MALLRRLRPAAFTPAALAVTGIALLVLVLPAPRLQGRLYAPNARPLWAAVLVLSVVALACQTRRLAREGGRTLLSL